LTAGVCLSLGTLKTAKGPQSRAPSAHPLGFFLSSARDSLFLFVNLCLYASVFSALRCADVVLFLHFLSDSLLARCLYSSILSALRVAISRFESQARGGRLLVVTRCAPCSAAAPVCCHSRKLASLKQCARWQQLYSPLDGRSANVTVLALPPLGWLLDVVGFMIKIHLQRFIIPEA